jgi:peptidoglycan L-alanyl-D-glutamate endopeptidase CwlK
MTYALSQRSLSALEGVRPALVSVVKRAIELTTVDFMVIEGLRTLERQRELLARGYSTTIHSRHLTGDAVDLAPIIDGKIPWNDWKPFEAVARAMKAAAAELKTPIAWGGDWKGGFRDGPHFELPRAPRPPKFV